jgi:hypothetical protein
MRNYKKRKKRIVFWILLIIFLISILGLLLFRKEEKTFSGRDLKVGIINKTGLQLVSISSDRKMINVLKIGESVPLWLPGGLGWFRSNQINKVIHDNASDKNLSSKLFWYNFGFFPDKIIENNDTDIWKDNWFLIQRMGFKSFMNYRFNSSQMLLKVEQINKDLNESKEVLNEIMSRDFAENEVLNEDLKLSIFNGSQESGLADFLSQRLEWSGFSVLNTDNTNEKVYGCEIRYRVGTNKNLSLKMLQKYFNCKEIFDGNLNDNEAELYFGEKYVSMVKYSSYNK